MPKREIPPFMWQVWFKGNKKPIEMSGFDEGHIRLMCGPGKVVKVKRMPEEKEEFSESLPLGPKGSVVHQPADYDRGFKILREWIDQNGGPPEDIRVKLRELWIDYDKAPRKTTRYSVRKKRRY